MKVDDEARLWLVKRNELLHFISVYHALLFKNNDFLLTILDIYRSLARKRPGRLKSRFSKSGGWALGASLGAYSALGGKGKSLGKSCQNLGENGRFLTDLWSCSNPPLILVK